MVRSGFLTRHRPSPAFQGPQNHRQAIQRNIETFRVVADTAPIYFGHGASVALGTTSAGGDLVHGVDVAEIAEERILTGIFAELALEFD